MSLDFSTAQPLVKKPSGMNAPETVSLLDLLTSSTLHEAEGAELLKSWAARGETGLELAATVRYLREKAVHVPVERPCFDLCGTGGSGLARYNVSTTVAFVAAAADVPVAKHGNRGSRAPNGSFDLLEALEIPFELTPQKEARLQKETGLCFVFARTHHPTVGKVVPYRKAAACRSIFNMAGPLANPAPIKHQIVGTIDDRTARVVAEALVELKTEGALVVWGEPGIDEISVTGKTEALYVSNGSVTATTWNEPVHPGLDYSTLPSGDASDNKETFLRLLTGQETGPLLDMICANAGAAIDLWSGNQPSPRSAGVQTAREMIDSGAAIKKFEEHRATAQALS